MPAQSDATTQGLAAAYELFRRGELDQAETVCRQLLSQAGDDGDVFTLLGMVTTQKGSPQAAIGYFEKAVAIQPTVARSHNNLGLACKRAGRLDEAEAAYRKALSLDGTYAQAHNNLGVVRRELGDFKEAVMRFESALEADPVFVDARKNLAQALLESGQAARAAAEFRRVLKHVPEDSESTVSLADALHRMGDTGEALTCLDRLLNAHPGHAGALIRKGDLLEEGGELEAARAAYDRALASAPDRAEAHDKLGVVLLALGDIDEAVSCFRRAIAARPELAEAHRHLAFARRHEDVDDDVRATQGLLESEANDNSVMHASFALAKIHDDLGQYDDAFAYVSRANRLKRRTVQFDIGQDRLFFEQLKQTFDETFFSERQGWALEDSTPIFIVGMPRSGTTLVEQILASHPRVWGAGEILHLDRVLWEFHEANRETDWCSEMAALGEQEVRDVAASYLAALKRSAPGADYITDKTPGNFHYLGMIGVMFSGAKVINCLRDPLDTCLSCYQNYFTQSVSFAYDLKELGTYYRLYAGLMEHWRAVLPSLVYDLRYEDLLQDQEAETCRLLDHCGLEWDDACLAFHATKRPVQTASVAQVRQPMYRSSVGRAARYGSHLDPLREALGDLA